jgi:hypothetical protein
MSKSNEKQPFSKEDFAKLTPEERVDTKLMYEIQALERSLEAPKTDPLGMVRIFFEKYFGQIITIGTLLAGVVAPVLSYVSNERKSHLIEESSPLLKIADTARGKDQAWKLSVSMQDPAVAAPFLLSYLNHSTKERKYEAQLVEEIYKKMYELNSDRTDYAWWDRITFSFTRDNKAILEDELYKNARTQFATTVPLQDGQIVVQAYVDLLFDLPLDHDQRFESTVKIVRQKCDSADYKFLCAYLDTKK